MARNAGDGFRRIGGTPIDDSSSAETDIAAAFARGGKDGVKNVADKEALKAENVPDSPKSVKAWTTSAARSAVAAGLAFFGMGTLSTKVGQIIHRIGYKRIVITVTALIAIQTLLVAAVIVSAIGAVTETATKPLSVIASLMDYVPGVGDDAEALKGVPDKMCKAAPVPTSAAQPTSPAVPLPDDEPDRVAGREDAPAESTTMSPESSATGYTPPSAYDTDGKLTEETTALMNRIPRGTDAIEAESWLLYALSHPPTDSLVTDLSAYAARYRTEFTKIYLERQRNSGGTPPRDDDSVPFKVEQTDKLLAAKVTPVEVNSAIDPLTDYKPFTLAAATMTGSLTMEETRYLVFTEEEQSAVFGRITTGCGI